MESTTLNPTLWPLAVYFGLTLIVVAGMLGVSYVLGQRHQGRDTGQPYESGMVPTGSARQRLSAKFYIVAMLFVIFDLEVAFIVAWVVAFWEVGWSGYLGAVIFIGILFLALLYEWRQGALDWASKERKKLIVRSEE